MDPTEVPHFHNEIGAARIRIGVKDFMCVGALPPFDHPHVFLNMGEANEVVCPYCATHFVFDATLGANCDPPQCAYNLEREADLSGSEPLQSQPPVSAPEASPAPKPPIAAAIDLDPRGGGLVASFTSEEALRAAMRELAGGEYELTSFGPTQPGRDRGESFLPKAMLAGGIVGASGGFAMQAYANVVAYPLDIGGRPEFSWPSFVPIAFEIGVLLAVLTGVIGFVLAASPLELWDPIDEGRPMRRVMRDGWGLSVRAPNLSRRARAMDILRGHGALDIEEIGA